MLLVIYVSFCVRGLGLALHNGYAGAAAAPTQHASCCQCGESEALRLLLQLLLPPPLLLRIRLCHAIHT
jgi:hypothetical protein